MILTMVPMRVMQHVVDQIVDVVSMWNRFVATAATMLMSFTTMFRSAADGALITHLNHVLVDVSFMRME